MNKSFLKSSSIVTGMTFLSRILGLVRDFFIAKFFGANEFTDAFLVAFRIPNFLRRLFGEGHFHKRSFLFYLRPRLTKRRKKSRMSLTILGQNF